MDEDERWMRIALDEADIAASKGEVPVGCALVSATGELLAAGHNLRETNEDPTAHAEMLAIREAAKRVGSWRLEGVTAYVTLEPCAMCAGAILHARIDKLVIGADDPKAGAAGSVLNIFTSEVANHRVNIDRGILAGRCMETLQAFFRDKRTKF